jgi:hypothetical protein
MTARSELEQTGQEHGWAIVNGVHSVSFKRPGGFVLVSYNRNGAVQHARIGGVSGYELTGPGKKARVIEELTKP